MVAMARRKVGYQTEEERTALIAEANADGERMVEDNHTPDGKNLVFGVQAPDPVPPEPSPQFSRRRLRRETMVALSQEEALDWTADTVRALVAQLLADTLDT